MITGRFDFLRTGRLLIGRRPVLPVLVLAAAPDGETEGTIGQLALVAGYRPQLWICVNDAPEWVWARIGIKIQKGDGTPAPSETKDAGGGALVCAATETGDGPSGTPDPAETKERGALRGADEDGGLPLRPSVRTGAPPLGRGGLDEGRETKESGASGKPAPARRGTKERGD